MNEITPKGPPRLPALCCPRHGVELVASRSTLECTQGCRFPVVRDVPRFVHEDGYVASFGVQWRKFRATQLDSVTGTSISRDRLARLLGSSLQVLAGRVVLDVGCGAGRFSEVLLDAGAAVWACDLSSAVDACQANLATRPHFAVCQADLLQLPFRDGFDVVICLGVLQHTASPEASIAALCRQVRPGGLLVIDHYRRAERRGLRRWLAVMLPTRVLRRILMLAPPRPALACTRALTTAMWPLHRLLWHQRYRPGVASLRRLFLRLSPVHDYHDSYPQLDEGTLREWALLDTHDDLTCWYRHGRSAGEIATALTLGGMTEIDVTYGGNGIEARALRPVSATSTDS